MLHHSFIGHVNSATLIVQIKEIEVAVFNHTNIKSIIKEALITKNIQGRVTYEIQYMAMTNMTVCSASNKQQSISDSQPNLDQIKYIGVPISIEYIWKSEFIKNENSY